MRTATRPTLGLVVLGSALALWSCVADLGPGTDEDELDLVGSQLRASRVALHFDVFGYGCPGGGATCPPSAEQCICQTEYDHLNAIRVLSDGSVVGHHIVAGGDSRRAEVDAQGNRLSVNINELNTRWEEDGAAARADAMMAWARAQFPSGVPEWFFLNEISRGAWTDPGDRGTRYRRYVADVARRLAVTHGRTVVVFSPFWRPGWDGRNVYAAAWRAVAEHAYIGIEAYIPGWLIQRNGFSETFCRNRYQQSIDAYTRLGVPVGRLMHTEHFGQTLPGTGWGRGGIGIEQWIQAIRVRTRAARSLPFAGYITYAWSFNRAGRSSSERVRAIDAYLRVGATRLALPDPGAAAAGEDARFDPSAPSEPEPDVEPDPGADETGTEPAPLPPDEEIPATDPPAGDPTGGCDPPHSIDVGGRCVPSCGAAGGNTCSTTGAGGCSGYAALESYDCEVCCFNDGTVTPPPPPPPDESASCVPEGCGGSYMDLCQGAPDGCGGALTCGDTCGDGLNCTENGLCKKALGVPCAGPGQCASYLCSWTTSPGTAARCCHDPGGWCGSDLHCCGSASCVGSRCVAP